MCGKRKCEGGWSNQVVVEAFVVSIRDAAAPDKRGLLQVTWNRAASLGSCAQIPARQLLSCPFQGAGIGGHQVQSRPARRPPAAAAHTPRFDRPQAAAAAQALPGAPLLLCRLCAAGGAGRHQVQVVGVTADLKSVGGAALLLLLPGWLYTRLSHSAIMGLQPAYSC